VRVELGGKSFTPALRRRGSPEWTSRPAPALARFGSVELKQQYLAPAIAGESVGCIGVSEPGAGSDVASLETHAVEQGGDYVVNGSKMWITNGLQADWCCLLANTSDGPAHRNKSLIGEEGKGFTYQMLQFQEERMWGAARNLRILDRVIDATIDYTRQRRVFGRPLLDNQVIHFRLAELRTEVEALRSLTYRAVDEYCSGKDVTRLNSVGGGADEIMLSVICKTEDTLPGRTSR
jgi:citronellyl-CoA dehydrogenase